MLLTSNNVSLHHCLATIPLFNRRCWTLPLWMQSLAATIYRCNGLPICSVICWTSKIALSLVMEKKRLESRQTFHLAHFLSFYYLDVFQQTHIVLVEAVTYLHIFSFSHGRSTSFFSISKLIIRSEKWKHRFQSSVIQWPFPTTTTRTNTTATTTTMNYCQNAQPSNVVMECFYFQISCLR